MTMNSHWSEERTAETITFVVEPIDAKDDAQYSLKLHDENSSTSLIQEHATCQIISSNQYLYIKKTSSVDGPIVHLETNKLNWNIPESHIVIPVLTDSVGPTNETEKLITIAEVEKVKQKPAVLIGLNKNANKSLFTQSMISTNVLQEADVLWRDESKFLPASDVDNDITYSSSLISCLKCDNWPVSKSKAEQVCKDITDLAKSFNLPSSSAVENAVVKQTINWPSNIQDEQLPLQDLEEQLSSSILQKSATSSEVLPEELLNTDQYQIVVRNIDTLSSKQDSENFHVLEMIPDSLLNSCFTKVGKTIQQACIQEPEPKTMKEMSVEGEPESYTESQETNLQNFTQTSVKNKLLSKVEKVGYNKISKLLNPFHKNYPSVQELKKIRIEPKSADCFEVPVEDIRKSSTSVNDERLPLKKKAKMKKSLVIPTPKNEKCNENILSDKNSITSTVTVLCSKETCKSETSSNDKSESDSDEPLASRIKFQQKKIKRKKLKVVIGKKKRKTESSCVTVDSTFSLSNNFQNKSKQIEDVPGGKTFKKIEDVVTYLRDKKLLSSHSVNILSKGLTEYKVDILKEMKQNFKQGPLCEYSVQLKMFAFMVYFCQPLAYSHLLELFQHSLPPLPAIKEWKDLLNSQKPKKEDEESDAVKCED